MPSDEANILVTGASTGIGRACAVHLASLGHTVFAGVRKEGDAQSLQDEIGERVVPVILDVTDAAAIERAEITVRTRVGDGGLHGLVNNAGVALGGPLEYLPIESWRMQLEVNVIGQVAVTKAMMPLLRQASGRVVFIGSIGGRTGTPMMGPYNASKFALEGIAEAFRQELLTSDLDSGMKVVLVEPGAVKTDIWEKGRSQADALEADMPEEARQRYASLIASVRKLIDRQDKMGVKPVNVAKVVERALFTPKPRARYLVGVDAKMGGALSRVLPDGAKDALMMRLTGVNPR
jgi:NAD(P)-dependent dehydrogenase (short-subunit alcohol dehydrogenase family)